MRNSPHTWERRLLSKDLSWTSPTSARAASAFTYKLMALEYSCRHLRIRKRATGISSAPKARSDCPISSIPILDGNLTIRCISPRTGFCTRSHLHKQRKSARARKIISRLRLCGRSNNIYKDYRRCCRSPHQGLRARSEEHTSELQSH